MGRVRDVLQEAVRGRGFAGKEDQVKVISWHTGNLGNILAGLLD
jgi:hypothetical protein